MKTIKFREVLWTIANKLGFDPEQENFLTNQAIPIGRYVDQWVRRSYDSRDWPELVVTREFNPSSHIVPYKGTDEVNGFLQAFQLGRVLKVHLLDPRTTAAPVATDFELSIRGVHCGHEHGSSVWIEYILLAPRYTAEVWDAGHFYAKDAVTYSPLSGECYHSRVNGNRNHDPGRSFQLPPELIQDPESVVPPEVVVFQDYIPHDPGYPGQTQKMRVDIHNAAHAVVPDPATARDEFRVIINDMDGGELCNVTVVGPGALSVVATALRSAITSASGFTVTVDPADARVFTIENLSQFSIQALYSHSPGGDLAETTYQLSVIQEQTYIPPRPGVEGQAQVTYIQLTTESTIPGATYRVTMTGSNGQPHPVQYASTVNDGMPQIIQGLARAIDNATDTFWEGVQRQANPGVGILFLAINDNASTSAVILLIGDPYWELNPMPLVLAEAVIRGAEADLLKEWGQYDKGAAEEAAVVTEGGVSESKFVPIPSPPLSGQQIPTSRYKA